jgi:catechol 2,3-dioxygenase-like lactoylglutathione lyase family enzyme
MGNERLPQEDAVSTNPHVKQVATVVVPVSDQERALDFYVGKLGLSKGADVPMGDQYRWLEVAPAEAATTIAIVPPPPDKPKPGVETGISLQTEDIDAYHALLKERGVDVDSEVTRYGDPVPPMFWLRDPDGNSLFVVEA